MKIKAKFLSYFFQLLMISATGTCTKREEINRDKITFINSTNLIENNITSLNSLMKKLPDTCARNFFFDYKGDLYINNTKMGQTSTLRSDTIKVLRGLTNAEKSNFIKSIIFLKKNEIIGSRLDFLFDTWVYSYRVTADENFEDYRGIFYQYTDVPLRYITQTYKILGKKGHLVLVKLVTDFQ